MMIVAQTTALALLLAPSPMADPVADAAEVARLDLAFQAAVKRNDAAAIDAILHEDYLLVLGDGRRISRAALIEEARSQAVIYQVQDEDPGTQHVKVWGDTAVVTARLRIKGERNGVPFERTLWFSDTYVRTDKGWKYAFAQASLPLPAEPTPRSKPEPSQP
jgi:ketosteroid isomerase-like protein